MRKAKIVATIGPASAGVENIVKLINAGMDCARLNFSHSDHEQHRKNISDIREASQKTGKYVAIIQDLQGPKIRTCKVKNSAVELKDGQEFIITTEKIGLGDEKIVATDYQNLIYEVKSGNTILLDDGYIILNVKKVEKNNVITEVKKGGILKDNKGIIVPGVPSSAPSLSEKDIADLKFGLEQGVDMVALSFVRSERDVIELKTVMKLYGKIVPIISKIERYEGFEDIEDIIQESDGIMVARGDLGLEMPAEKVPVLQKEIIRRCNYYGKPVIVATQMLESMINNPRPTRAEASDVANAVLDGADALMLSGETSVGKYPFDAVDYMNRIILSAEEIEFSNLYDTKKAKYNPNSIIDALSKASCVISEQISVKAIVAITYSGWTAKNIAKYRPQVPIFAICNSVEICNQLSLVWGVIPIFAEFSDISDVNISEILFKNFGNYFENEDQLIVVSGLSKTNEFQNNTIKVQKILR